MSDTLPVQVRGLSKTYKLGFLKNKRVRALQGLDLQLEPGQVFGLLGPNGAGKSTTIKILMNLVQPTSGEATLFGRPPSDARARRMLGFLPENPAPYEYLTGREFVQLAGTLTGLTRHELDARVDEVLGLVGMGRAANLQIRRYSKGMIQRVGLAQAIVHRPRLLVLDEPTSGLDPVGRRQMRDLILAERERGTTVLFCTHIISDVEALCDRMAVLVGGRRVREGSVRELVTSQAPVVEVTLEGVTPEQVQGWGHALQGVQSLGEQRVLLRASDAVVQPLLREALAHGARVAQLNSIRHSLEDLFMEAIQEAGTGPTVGGEIS